MKRRERSAPIWLFSFVDLAFLLLIALTQLAPDPAKKGIEVAELDLPRIAEFEPESNTGAGQPRWQLRILPMAPPAPGADPQAARTPFELIAPDAPPSTTPDAAVPIGAEELTARLSLLHERAQPRPLLAPHRDARSEDLLAAVALLEEVWASDRRVRIERIPAVSAQLESTGSGAASRSASAPETR